MLEQRSLYSRVLEDRLDDQLRISERVDRIRPRDAADERCALFLAEFAAGDRLLDGNRDLGAAALNRRGLRFVNYYREASPGD